MRGTKVFVLNQIIISHKNSEFHRRCGVIQTEYTDEWDNFEFFMFHSHYCCACLRKYHKFEWPWYNCMDSYGAAILMQFIITWFKFPENYQKACLDIIIWNFYQYLEI